MTVTTPAAPMGAPIGFFPFRIPTYNNIQPFTYKAGQTYLDKLEDIQDWLVRYLTPYIDETVSDYVDAFNEALTKFNEGSVAFQAWVLEQKGEFQGKIDEFKTLADQQTAAFNTLAETAMAAVTAKVGAAEAERVKAEAARDLAEQYAAQAGTKADNTIAAFFRDLASATYSALVSVIDERTATPIAAKTRARISVEHKIFSINGKQVPYAVTRVVTPGFIPLTSGVIEKRFAGDFDVTNPTSTGASFRPPGENMDRFTVRTGSVVGANAGAWNVSTRELYGAQIRNGVKFHEATPNLAGTKWGVEGVGVAADGRMRCYSALRGDTADSMIAAGVVHSWFGGPNLIVDGVGQDLTLRAWDSFLTEISARTIIGQNSAGHYVVISAVGSTGSEGINGPEAVQLAQRENLYNASLFDGGGSTQLHVAGEYSVFSSDGANGTDGTWGRRKVGDAILFRGELITGAFETGWRDIPLRDGFAVYNGQTPQVRTHFGAVELRGTVAPASGRFGPDQVLFADLPRQFGFETGAKSFLGIGDGGNTRKIAVLSNRTLSLAGQSTFYDAAYIALDSVRWGTL